MSCLHKLSDTTPATSITTATTATHNFLQLLVFHFLAFGQQHYAFCFFTTCLYLADRQRSLDTGDNTIDCSATLICLPSAPRNDQQHQSDGHQTWRLSDPSRPLQALRSLCQSLRGRHAHRIARGDIVTPPMHLKPRVKRAPPPPRRPQSDAERASQRRPVPAPSLK